VYDVPDGSGLASAAGGVVQVVGDRSDSVWVRFPQPLESAIGAASVFNRKLEVGDSVPTTVEGLLLTTTSHSILPIEQQGDIRYFRQRESGLTEVDYDEYEALPIEERGPVRYFRIVAALGEESPYDGDGELLTETDYNRLPASRRGAVVSLGDLIRLRFASRIFLQGSNLKVAVRNGASGGVWQEASAEDVTEVAPGFGLEILAQGAGNVVEKMQVAPNPFTPNGDAINDQTTISFSLFRVHAARPVGVHIYSLDGRRVRTIERAVSGGAQQFSWDGRADDGALVAPGLYIAQVDVETDAEGASGQQLVQLVGVAY